MPASNRKIYLTKKQDSQIEALNKAWDYITTAEGLFRLVTILGRENYHLYLNALIKKEKLDIVIIDDEDDELAMES